MENFDPKEYPLTYTVNVIDEEFTISSLDELTNKLKTLGFSEERTKSFAKVRIYGYVKKPKAVSSVIAKIESF